jgi:RNA polymerase sigma-70 factor (ECF subfamily)
MTDPARPLPADQGDADDLIAQLSERYADRLRIFAARRLRVSQGVAHAEEVVQDAFRIALEAVRDGRITEPQVLPTFAFETVKNLCMRRNRSAGREAGRLELLARAGDATQEDALTSVIKEESRREVRTALNKLDPGDRQILEMTYVETRTSDDIGQRLAISAGAVRVRRHRALQRLGALLGVTPRSRRE